MKMQISTGFQSRPAAALAVVLLAAGCGERLVDEENTDVADEQGAIIFPDDPDACETPAPLACPRNFSLLSPGKGHTLFKFGKPQTISVLDDHGENVTEFLGGAATAKLNQSTISCSRNGAFTVSNTSPPTAPFAATTFTAPWLLMEDRLAFGSTFFVNGAKGGLTFSAPTRAGNDGIYCSDASITKPFPGVGLLSDSPFASRYVQLVGVYDHFTYDAQQGKVGVYCVWFLRNDQAFVNRTRPSDIISTSGERFVRGYELTGNALASACSNIAGLECIPSQQPTSQEAAGIASCISTSANACITRFSRPDPCRRTCARPCTTTANCGTHETCSNRCCVGNPF